MRSIRPPKRMEHIPLKRPRLKPDREPLVPAPGMCVINALDGRNENSVVIDTGGLFQAAAAPRASAVVRGS